MNQPRSTLAAAQSFPTDPRSLTLPERAAWHKRLLPAQRAWAARLPDLVEPPAPGQDFPAFLLETPAFLQLNRRIGEATARAQLPVAVADELQHFVDVYRDYLRTAAGEEVFTAPPKRG
jgi:hypothetical protein